MPRRTTVGAVMVALAAVGACGGDSPPNGDATVAPTVTTMPAVPTTTTIARAPVTTTAPPATWSAAPSLLRGRSSHGLVELDGALYVLGGTGEGGKPVFEVERFDGEAWTVVSEIAGHGVNAPSAAAVDGRIFLIGGFSGTSGGPVDDVHVFDPATGTWSGAAPLPTASGGHAAAVLGGRIHVIGGGTSRSTIADHVAYDPASDTWTSLAPLPLSEGSPAAAVLDGQLWAIGGRSGTRDFGDVFVYDVATDAWSKGPPIEPHGTAGAAVACGTIYLLGGESQDTEQVLGDVYVLDGNAWRASDPLLQPRAFARAVALGDAIYVVGGSADFGRSHSSPGLDSVERLVPEC